MNQQFKDKIAKAFDLSCNGYSADRVIADPELNTNYLNECRNLELENSDYLLNKSLLNLRKQGGLSGRPPSKRTILNNQMDYRFAAEMSVRFLERRDHITLDRILCDPSYSIEFDNCCRRIAPGYSSFEYRWSALSLRKASRMSPEILARVASPTVVKSFQVDSIKLSDLPSTQGLYLFFESQQLLYVGESENLQKRLKKHLDHSDNKGLAKWLWEEGTEGLHLEIQQLPNGTTTKVRRALELELIRSRNPLFNVKR